LGRGALTGGEKAVDDLGEAHAIEVRGDGDGGGRRMKWGGSFVTKHTRTWREGSASMAAAAALARERRARVEVDRWWWWWSAWRRREARKGHRLTHGTTPGRDQLRLGRMAAARAPG